MDVRVAIVSRSGKRVFHPDSTSVDRSRGMCDRMVEKDDGSLTMDWDGSFVSVEVQNDTIWIREGWLR